tara:strand:- start:35 stop:268 length:234 start_codon:yes stop_codon:yes gene_type:complete
MKTYVVWNPERVSMFGDATELSLDTYEGLKAAEKSDFSISSRIDANDEKQLKQFLHAIYYETDINMSYHLLEKANEV